MEIRFGNWHMTLERTNPREEAVLVIILKENATGQEIEAARQKALKQKVCIATVA